MRIPAVFLLPLLGIFVQAEDRAAIREEIVKRVLKPIIAMTVYDEYEHPVASRFHVGGCRKAAEFEHSRLERYKRLKRMIDDDSELKDLVKAHGIKTDEFIDDWLNMADETEKNFIKLEINPAVGLPRLCLTAFCEEFRRGNEETRKNLLILTLQDMAITRY